MPRSYTDLIKQIENPRLQADYKVKRAKQRFLDWPIRLLCEAGVLSFERSADAVRLNPRLTPEEKSQFVQRADEVIPILRRKIERRK